ncbi:MAG: hypothetical protein WC450_10645 [Candidatus Omnitrophota bacterium]
MARNFSVLKRLEGVLPRNYFNIISLLLILCVFILGKTGIAAGDLVLMQGELDFIQKTLTVRLTPGTEHNAVFQIRPVSETSIQIFTELDNWPTRFFSISTVMEASLDLIPDGEAAPGYSGRLRSRYMLLNNKPVEDITARFVLKNQAVSVERVSLGNCVVTGVWEWDPPHRFHVTVEFADIPLYDIVSLFMSVPEGEVEGESSGKIRLSGNYPDVMLQAELVLTNGYIGDLEYRQLRLKGEGPFPKFRITDSFVSQTDGFTFKISGMLNLGRLDNFSQQLRSLQRKPVVKSTDAETEWTLKRIEADDKSGTTELKYLYRRKENINTMSDEDVDLIGIEQKLKF